jgi:uncharacterized protein
MRRYLIVANRTMGGRQLHERVRQAVQEGPCFFHLLVPLPAEGGRADRDRSVAEAAARLDAEQARFDEMGAVAEGELTDEDPFEAVHQAVAGGAFDEVIVCTLPAGISRWLGQDLPHRLASTLDVPVTHLVAPAGLPTRITAHAVRVSIYLGESDQHGQHPLHHEIVRRARAAGLAGATVFRGMEGYGASSVIHTARLLTLSEDLPVTVVIIDTPERVDAFLPTLDDLITEGLVVREDVDIVKYAGREPWPGAR